MKSEELERVVKYDIRNRYMKKGQKFVPVTYSNNQEIKHHMMCLHMYNNMLSSNKAYILLYHVWPHLISTGEIIFNIRWEESRNSTNSFYVGGNWGSEIQLLDLGHTAGYLQSQDLSFPAISAKSQFPLALLLNLIWQFILRPGWLFPKVWEPGIISV